MSGLQRRLSDLVEFWDTGKIALVEANEQNEVLKAALRFASEEAIGFGSDEDIERAMDSYIEEARNV